MSLFGLSNHTSALKRLVLISGVLINTREDTSLIWESGSGSDSATVLVGKIESEIPSLQFSVFSLIKGMQWIRTEILSLSRVDALRNSLLWRLSCAS